ncbi:MAG: HPr family phosphocarrier protein [Floccifex porci]|uniref:HPr family phosphocarrier protein n=1 Tax=Floccifex porci TaxID=2606629 RepID=UPI003F0B9264
MKKFEYTIQDEIGIHARPAGMLVKEAKKYESKIIIKKGDKEVAATKLMAVMGLAVKCGDTIEIEVTGSDEDVAAGNLESFFKENL